MDKNLVLVILGFSCYFNFFSEAKTSKLLIPVKEQFGKCELKSGHLLAIGETYYDVKSCSKKSCRNRDTQFFVEHKYCFPSSENDLPLDCRIIHHDRLAPFPDCCPRVACFRRYQTKRDLRGYIMTPNEKSEGTAFLKCLIKNPDFMASSNDHMEAVQKVKRALEEIFDYYSSENGNPKELSEEEIEALIAVVDCFAENIKLVDHFEAESFVEFSQEPLNDVIPYEDTVKGSDFFVCLIQKPNIFATSDEEEEVVEFVNETFVKYLSKGQTESLTDTQLDSLRTIVSCSTDLNYDY